MKVLRATAAEIKRLEDLRRLAQDSGATDGERDAATRAADRLEGRLRVEDESFVPPPPPLPPAPPRAPVHPARCFIPWCPHCDAIRAYRTRRFG